jgi:hypothetical protein
LHVHVITGLFDPGNDFPAGVFRFHPAYHRLDHRHAGPRKGRPERAMHARSSSLAAAVVSTLFLAACNGSSSSAPAPAGTVGTLRGTVVMGPVSGAHVAAYAVAAGTMGAQIGGGTTDSLGNFSIAIGDYAGPVMLQASGGAYVDEATGATMTMQPGDVLACAIPSVAAGATTTGIQVTPLTTMAHARAHHMTGGITSTSIAEANAAVGAYFSVGDILHAMPMDPTVAGSGATASPDARNHGMALAAMSQYARTLGMPSSSGMVTAMADDASDGVMDGRMGGTPISMAGMGGMTGGTMSPTAGTSGLSSAMGAFVGSAMNRSGVTLTDMQGLMTMLAGSNGAVGAGGTTTGMVSGTATMGPVAGATVTAFAVANGMVGAQVGSAATDTGGNFAVPIGSYAGPVLLQVTGGTYPDEATGSTMSMQAGDALTACLPPVSTGAATTGVQVTPLTTMAHARARAMTGGMTDANVAAAQAAVGSYFSVTDVLHTVPMDPAVAGSGASATPDQVNYGMSIAAMSQYAQTIGMPVSSGMVTAMADDATDGVMDGKMGGTPISMMGMGGMMGGTMSATAGTTGLSAAMSAFVGSAMNHSGVTLAGVQALVTKLGTSNGQLPGAGGTVSPQGSVSGAAFMGAMSGGTVTAYSVLNGAMGPMIASGALDATGAFSMPIGAYSGSLMLQVAGATFMDAASGTSMTMQPGDVLTACIPSVTAGSATAGVQVTPLTSMAQMMAQYRVGGMTAGNVTTANGEVGSYFLAGDILMTAPMDPSVPGSAAGATAAARNHGMSIAAMSQYARSVGMTTSSSGMVTAMMQDAADGTMNGMMGSTPVSMGGMGGMMGGTMMQAGAGTTGLATAMTTFTGSAMNRSGATLADVQTLVNKLSTSNGTIQ